MLMHCQRDWFSKLKGKLDIDKLKNVPSNLSNLKSKVDILDIGKLWTTFDLSKPSNVGNNYVVKNTEYDELVKQINAIQKTDTSNLIKNTDYDTNINEIE